MAAKSQSERFASALSDLLAARRRECLAQGWAEVPEWVFCSTNGERWWDERHFSRVWERLRRRAQREGVRPFKLHATRHTWATFALRAGKSIRWVADQLGHADASTTPNHYAHAMREDESDLSFLNLGVAKRRYPSPTQDDDAINDDAPDANHRGR